MAEVEGNTGEFNDIFNQFLILCKETIDKLKQTCYIYNMMIKFNVTGLGKTYQIDANSHTEAKRKAVKLYREENPGKPYTRDFLTMFFSVAKVNPNRRGRKNPFLESL